MSTSFANVGNMFAAYDCPRSSPRKANDQQMNDQLTSITFGTIPSPLLFQHHARHRLGLVGGLFLVPTRDFEDGLVLDGRPASLRLECRVGCLFGRGDVRYGSLRNRRFGRGDMPPANKERRICRSCSESDQNLTSSRHSDVDGKHGSLKVVMTSSVFSGLQPRTGPNRNDSKRRFEAHFERHTRTSEVSAPLFVPSTAVLPRLG